MAIQLLVMLSDAVSPEILQGLTRAVGEGDGAVRSGVSALLPALLGGLANKAASPSGAGSVLSMLTGANVDTGLLGTLGNLLGSGQTGALMQSGTSLLSGLFGSDKVAGLGGALASVAGIKASSAGNLAALIAPLAFSALKRYIGQSKLDAPGLGALLTGQRDQLAGKLDPRLSAALGLSAPGSLFAGLPSVASAVSGAASAVGSAAAGVSGAAAATARSAAGAVGSTAAAASTAATQTAAAASSGIGRWLPWIIGAAILAFLLPQLKSCGAEKTAPKPTVAAPAVTPAPAAAPTHAPTAAPAAVVAAAPAATTTATPAATMEWPVKVYFQTGQSAPGNDGQAAIKAAAAALMADTAKKVGLTGFTDKTGNAEANEKLAKDRAVGVRDALKAAGVAEDRIAMKPPVFVEAGKAGDDPESRRVDIVLE